MKAGSNFRLSKTSKRMISLMKGSTSEQRNQFKSMMIDAELSASIQPRLPKSRKEDVKA